MQSTTRELLKHQMRGKEKEEGAEGKERLHQEEEEHPTLVASNTKETVATKLVRIGNILKYKVNCFIPFFGLNDHFHLFVHHMYIFYPIGSKEKIFSLERFCQEVKSSCKLVFTASCSLHQ